MKTKDKPKFWKYTEMFINFKGKQFLTYANIWILVIESAGHLKILIPVGTAINHKIPPALRNNAIHSGFIQIVAEM